MLNLYCLKFFKDKCEELEQKLEVRRKEFHVLISSIHSLQGILAKSDDIMDVSLENYEEEGGTSTKMDN